MVHKPKHKVHSFRGLLGDGGQDEINLERQNVNIAYRIIKFELFPYAPGAFTQESLVMIFKEEQTIAAPTNAVTDFGDPDLLGAALYTADASGTVYPEDTVVVFDNVLFSRNIWVGHTDQATGAQINYYIEIEEVPVGAATLMQLKLGTARKLIGGKIGPTPA